MDPSTLIYMEKWDDTSFRLFMEQYGPDVWNYIYFLTKNKETSDDLSQEVFIRAYIQISTFRGQSAVKTWLFTIARNLVKNYFRSAFFRKVTLVEVLSSRASARSAEQEVLDQLVSEQIWELLLQLPRKHREVLLLSVHHGLSMKEMAVILGIAEGTVKSRLARARRRIAELLREEEMRYDTV